GVEAEGDEARSVRRAPFARGSVGQAPEERRGAVTLNQAIADKGEHKGKRRRLVAIGCRLDLVQAEARELAPRDLPLLGGSASLPLGGGGIGVRGQTEEGGGQRRNRSHKGAGGAGRRTLNTGRGGAE